MKQKIVMKVQFSSEKRRTEAFKIAAGTTGVSSVSIVADKDQLVVIGDGVDSVCLTKSLRNKLRYVEIVSVEEVKNEAKKPVVESIPIQWASGCYVNYPMHYDALISTVGDQILPLLSTFHPLPPTMYVCNTTLA